MITARNREGERVPVVNSDGSTNEVGYCPCCKKRMIAKVGTGIRRSHWAHRHAERCDEWWEDESEWHINWRNLFLEKAGNKHCVDIENVLEKNGRRHFYDIRLYNRLAIILRRARLTDERQHEYEDFFGEMLWMVESRISDYNRLQEQCVREVIKVVEEPPSCYACCFWLRSSNGYNSFFSKWERCSVPVVFDFTNASRGKEKNLWILLPHLSENPDRRYMVKLSVHDFCENRLLRRGQLFGKSYAEVSLCINKRINKSETNSCNLSCTSYFEPKQGALHQGNYNLIKEGDSLGDKASSSLDFASSHKENSKEIKEVRTEPTENSKRIFSGDSSLAKYWERLNQ